MGNTTVGVKVNIDREMQIFDRLPEWLRELLRYAEHDYSVEEAAKLFVFMKKNGNSQQYMSYEFRRRLR